MHQGNLQGPNTDNFIEALQEMEAGVLINKLASMLQDTALATTIHGSKRIKGKVTLEFSISKINNDGNMVNIDHKITYSKPTPNGKTTEEATTSTPFHVGPRGILSLHPINQGRLDIDKGTGEITNHPSH